ncbi:MAG: SpoIIE family protein phosphatase [Alphaproteobacteria bacterium]|nr:SpoIIE family protein phosphatase [Alphaproteobacteria bacterium]
MFVDVWCHKVKKYNQNAFGDYFVSKREKDGKIFAVLSDGLGSGIKANILSCMTSTMLLKFMEKEVPIKEAAEIIMNSLPVCQVRKISYATFSAVQADEDGNVLVVEEGNPSFLRMKGDEICEPNYHEVISTSFPDRHLRVYQFKADLGDRLVFCSDGVTQAGMGESAYPLGFTREGFIRYVKGALKVNPEISSSNLASKVVMRAMQCEPEMLPQDDISCAVMYFRNPRKALIFTGPPYEKQKDGEYTRQLLMFGGKKAICGGTTANLVSRESKRPVISMPVMNMGSLPPISKMDGVDLVTEGILTLTRTLEYLEQEKLNEQDAAGELVKFLLDCDMIEFMVGAMLNQAHYDPSLPIEIEIRRNVIKKMKKVLENNYFKRVTIHYV